MGPRKVIYFSRKDNANCTTYTPPKDLLDGFYGTCSDSNAEPDAGDPGGGGRINGGTGGGGGGGKTGEPPPLAGGGGAAGAQDGAATGDGRTGGYQGARCSQTASDRDGGGGGSGGGCGSGGGAAGRPSPAAAAAAAAGSGGGTAEAAAGSGHAASAGGTHAGTADAAAGTGAAAPPDSDCSNIWMFSGIVARRYQVQWDADANAADHASELGNKVQASLPEIGEDWKTTFSVKPPAPIEFAVIVSDIDKMIVDAEEDRLKEEYWLFMPIRGYVITAMSVRGEAWKESIPLCDEDGTPLTWTKITGDLCMCLTPRGR